MGPLNGAQDLLGERMWVAYTPMSTGIKGNEWEDVGGCERHLSLFQMGRGRGIG